MKLKERKKKGMEEDMKERRKIGCMKVEKLIHDRETHRQTGKQIE